MPDWMHQWAPAGSPLWPWAVAMASASLLGGAAIALVWLACRLLPRLPAWAVCWLWRIAYARLLVAAVCAAPLALPVLPPARTAPAESSSGPVGPTRDAILFRSAPTPVESKPRFPVPAGDLALAAGFLLWAAGTAVCAGGLVRQALHVRRLVRSSRTAPDGPIPDAAATLAFEYGLRRVPEIRIADGSGSPMLVAAPHPVILLPEALLAAHDDTEIELMLAHEFAHSQRGDLGWTFLPWLAHAFFWFHPLVWLAGREYRLAQEIACDELALRVSASPPAPYGRVLVAVAARSRLNLALGLAAVGLEETPDTLKRRLRAMRDKRALGGSAQRVICAGLGLAAALGIVPFRLVARADANDAGPAVAYRAQPGEVCYQLRLTGERPDGIHAMAGSCRVRLTQSGVGLQADCTGAFSENSGVPAATMSARLGLSPNGTVTSQSGGFALPFKLGDLAILPFPQLPEPGQAERVRNSRRQLADGRGSGGTLTATEFERLERAGGETAELEFRRSYLLQTDTTAGQSPELRLEGTGSFWFDPQRGILTRSEFRGVLAEQRPDGPSRTQITLSLSLAPVDNPMAEAGGPDPSPSVAAIAPNPLPIPLTQGDPKSDANRQSGQPLRIPPSHPPSLDTNDSKSTAPSASAPLAAGEMPALPTATGRDSGRREARPLSPHLAALLKSDDRWMRLSAARQLKTEGDASATPALVECLSGDDFALRWAALEALGAIGDGRAATALAACVAQNRDRPQASAALSALGAVAEPAALQLLSHPDFWVRLEACHVLAKVGTRSSAPALERAAADRSGLVVMAAHEALTQIRARTSQGPSGAR